MTASAGKVVFVDDDDALRVAAVQGLELAGFDVAAFDNGPAALKALSRDFAGAVVSDVRMPGMDGLALFAAIRKLPRAMMMPIVILAPVGKHCNSPEIAATAPTGCLTKPIKPAQLHEVLLRVISGAKPVAKKNSTPSKLDPNLSQRLPLRMLLCDDNAINQKVAARLLQQMGYKAEIAANGVEALAALDKQEYDLIFMDIQMPEMDGVEAAQAMRKRLLEKCPVLAAVTANAFPGAREEYLSKGFDDYLSKPLMPDALRQLIARCAKLKHRIP